MPTANMGLTLPTNHGSADVWDSILEDVFGLLDEHDHSTGKGVAIPSSALNINADVPWNSAGSYYAITGLKALDFQPSLPADVTGYAGALFVSSDDNELYWRTPGGTNVQLTDANTLNVASFTGGIGGDYSAVTALLDYDDATDTYRLRQELNGGVRQYAKLGVADIILREYDAAGDATVPVETVTLKSPDALAASYALTMPAALPAGTSLLQITSAGVLTPSNTPPSFAGLTLDNNTNITLQGTGYVKHGNRTAGQVFVPYHSSAAATISSNLSGSNDFGYSLPASSTHYIRIEGLEAGMRLKTIYVDGVGQLAGAGNATYDVVKQSSLVTGAPTSLLAAPVTGANTTETLTIDGGGYSVFANDMIFLKVEIPGATTFGYYHVRRQWDRP